MNANDLMAPCCRFGIEVVKRKSSVDQLKLVLVLRNVLRS